MASKALLAVLAALPLFAVDATFPDPALDVKATAAKQTVVLAGGCFWCVEAVFEIMEGVDDVISGYSGDTKETAKYDIVSSGGTKHAASTRCSAMRTTSSGPPLACVHVRSTAACSTW